jgi:hypothetical protein
MKRTPCPSGDIREQEGMTCRNDAQSPARCRRREVRIGLDRQSLRAGCPASVPFGVMCLNGKKRFLALDEGATKGT